MRLTHIKLAGFKSFAEPTVIPVPAQLTGVVGPNGCGKSNVIDAVRWVLGESAARNLRGETLQDVIFNGSATRKPASRASVELLFDNSAGRAAGAWSQYAEIAVKRVLDRSGESIYTINNLRVRRRDVADLFLGTGVGARAYAIIEQGMIARLIEARPEELRGYLEEAAGVSKYRERRRETASRLSDARDNLARVEDIRDELARQIARLEGQAEVAGRYRALQAELTETQHLLWYARRLDALRQRERIASDLAEAENRLEAETARLRAAEAGLERTREALAEGQETLSVAQAAFYAAQAEVSRVEQARAHQASTRQRLAQQIDELGRRLDLSAGRLDTLTRQHEALATELPALQVALAQAEAASREANDTTLPDKEAALRAAQQALAEAQRALSELERTRQLDENSLTHTRRQHEELAARIQKLEQERDHLPRPDAAGLAQKTLDAEALATRQTELAAVLAQAESALPALDAARQQAEGEAQRLRQTLAAAEAEAAALARLQATLDADQKLAAWLETRGLAAMPRLWQRVRVEAGWEAAAEAVLRERLQALVGMQGATTLEVPPPTRLSLVTGASSDATASLPDALVARLESDDPAIRAALADWLAGVVVAPDTASARRKAATLAPGECVVTPEGHVFTRTSLTFHGPSTALEGVLARRRDLERLESECARLRPHVAEADAACAAAREALARQQKTVHTLRQEAAQAQTRAHAAQMERLRLQQAFERVDNRRRQIEAELAELAPRREALEATRQAIEARLAGARAEEMPCREMLYAARQQRDQADRAVHEAREALRRAERRQQEARFAHASAEMRLAELDTQIQRARAESDNDRQQLDRLRDELAAMPADALDAELQAALDARNAAEKALADARSALDALLARQREEDSARLAITQALDPLRSRIEALRLKDQEAQLTQAQFELQLREAAADEALLATRIADAPRPPQLQAALTRLQNEIAALGAVNLAALEELESTRERAGYLESQHADLTDAVATLEDAIRKIDQESRARLRATFETVNRHLGELFPRLFEGGEARLILTGEEVLDAGVQVFAQPPGKKNASIQMLSGGEKTLTALALVFSLFKLNPAPFCLLDEVDAPLDDANTERYCKLVRAMSADTQFLFITHNRVTMEMAQHLAGVTMQEPGVSRIVAVDVAEAAALGAA